MNRQFHYSIDSGELYTTLEDRPESTVARPAVTGEEDDDDQRDADLKFLAMAGNVHAQLVAALEACHYEFVCLEPRLSGRFQANARACKEAAAAALALAKAVQS